jgi:hypothetical protein
LKDALEEMRRASEAKDNAMEKLQQTILEKDQVLFQG